MASLSSVLPGARRLLVQVGRRTAPAASSLIRARPFSGAPDKPTADNPSKSPYTNGAHRSNAEKQVADFPVVEVEGHVALCDGGGGALGHPIEYIQLDNVHLPYGTCGYCGLRFKAKHGHHGGH